MKLQMRGFTLQYPGTWIEHADRDWAWKAQGYLSSMETAFWEATVACHLFSASLADVMKRHRPAVTNNQDSKAHAALFYRFLAEEQSTEDALAKWASAVAAEPHKQGFQHSLPSECLDRLPLLYAKAFVYALFEFINFADLLAALPGVPRPLKAQMRILHSRFSDLTPLRHSLQHLEDRSRGVAKKKRVERKIDLKPIRSQLINAPHGGVLAINNIEGHCLCCTLADGRYGKVEISEGSLSVVQKCLQTILDSFQWIGPPQIRPSGL